MEDIIEELRKELSKQFCQVTVDSFIGFLKTDNSLQKSLQRDFEHGKNLCIEIIKKAGKYNGRK